MEKIVLGSELSINMEPWIIDIFLIKGFVSYLLRGWRTEKTIHNYVDNIKRFISFSKFKRITDFLNSKIFDDAYDEVLLRPVQNTTRKKYRDALIRYYEFLIYKKFIKKNLAKQMDSIKEDEVDPDYLSPKQIETIGITIKDMHKHKNFLRERNLMMIDVFLNSWIRKKELINLEKWNLLIETDMYWNKQASIKIHAKWWKKRYVIITVEFSKKLKRWCNFEKKNSKYVFCCISWKKMTHSAVNKVFQRLSTKLWFSVSPHILRHTYGWLLVNNWVPQKILQQQYGHKKLSTTDRYTRNKHPYIHNEINSKFCIQRDGISTLAENKNRH